MSGVGIPVLGDPVRPPIWFKPHHNKNFVTMVRRPIFARALHTVAQRRRHNFDGFAPLTLDELEERLGGLEGVRFYDEILREYSVGEASVRIPVESAIADGVVGLVAPRTWLDFQQLVAQALAELAGAQNAALARTLATDFLPLVLCRTIEEIVVWLERVGIDPRGWDHEEAEFDLGETNVDEIAEETLRQVMSGLNTEPEHDTPPPAPPTPTSEPAASLTVTIVMPTVPLPLPAIETVNLVVADISDAPVSPRQASPTGGPGGWSPRTGAEVDRDRELGMRGENWSTGWSLNECGKLVTANLRK